MSAWSELQEELEDGEAIESVCFGEWGWGRGEKELGYCEPDPPPVPFDKRGVPLTAAQAKPLMQSWSFDGGYGAPMCYAVYVWTDRQVLWVTQYDGSTGLSSAPRNPSAGMPTMPGG